MTTLACQADSTTRLVVRGADENGLVVVLEQVYEGEIPAERLEVWSVPEMSAPFHHDVHLARETVSTTYERASVPAGGEPRG